MTPSNRQTGAPSPDSISPEHGRKRRAAPRVIRQQKPLPHILMCLEPSKAALKKLSIMPHARERIAKALEWDGRPKPEEFNGESQAPLPPRAVEALREVSVAYAKYRTGAAEILREYRLRQRRKHLTPDDDGYWFPRDRLSWKLLSRAAERAEIANLRDAMTRASDALDLVSKRPMEGLIFLLGDDPNYQQMSLVDRRTVAKKKGWKYLLQLQELLFSIGAAADEALAIIPQQGRPRGPSNKKKSQPSPGGTAASPRTTSQGPREVLQPGGPSDEARSLLDFLPVLAKSLVHELADIWCRYHHESYSAPKTEVLVTGRKYIRPDHRAAWFVETVLKEGRVKLRGAGFVRISAAVRSEREETWAIMNSSDRATMRRRLELDAAPLDYVSRYR